MKLSELPYDQRMAAQLSALRPHIFSALVMELPLNVSDEQLNKSVDTVISAIRQHQHEAPALDSPVPWASIIADCIIAEAQSIVRCGI